MKTLVTFLLIVLTSFSSKSQNWPAEESEWYYCKSTSLSTFGFDIYSYTNDSLINDTAYALIRPTFMTNGAYSYEQALENNQITLVRQSGDTIYRRVEESEYIFFINGLEVGDGFTTFRSSLFSTNLFSCSPNLELEVIDEDVLDIDGEEFRIIIMQDMNFSSIYNFEILDPIIYNWIEGVGLQFDFPYFNYYGYAGNESDGACEQTVSESLELELYQYLADGLDFELGQCGVSSTGKQKALNFKIYPNPASTILRWDEPAEEVEIYDMLGKRVLQKQLTDLKNELYLEGISPGLYSIVFHTNDGVDVQKLVVQ